METKQHKVTVANLRDGSESLYMNISPIDALINEWLLANNQASQIHNPPSREKALALVKSGNRTYAINDFCVLK